MKNVKSLVLLGLLTAILIVFSFTPIGTLPIGPLSITLNIIPVASQPSPWVPPAAPLWAPFLAF